MSAPDPVTARLGPSEEDGYMDVVHVTDEDVSDARKPSPEQARAIELLELNPGRHPRPRLTLAQWRHVDRVVVTLGSLGVPTPRKSPESIRQEAR